MGRAGRSGPHASLSGGWTWSLALRAALGFRRPLVWTGLRDGLVALPPQREQPLAHPFNIAGAQHQGRVTVGEGGLSVLLENDQRGCTSVACGGGGLRYRLLGT
jgi:hypothetical protein